MRVLRALIVVAICVASVNVMAARPGQTESESASLSGTASQPSGRALSNANVQLRNVSNGQIVGQTTTNATGQFSFLNLPAGTYLAEVLNANAQIVATSSAVVVSSGWAITGVNVTASADAGSGHHIMSPHAAIILGAAGAAGVAGGIAMASGTASPSQ